MHASSVMILNQRPSWQSLGGQHGKTVDGLLKKPSFQTKKKLTLCDILYTISMGLKLPNSKL